MVASAQSRVVVAATEPNNVQTRMLLSQRIARSAIPDRAVSAPLRRLASPRGPISARFQRPGGPRHRAGGQAEPAHPIVTPERRPAGLVTMNQVSDSATIVRRRAPGLSRFERINPAFDEAPPLSNFTVVPEGAQRCVLDFAPGGSEQRRRRRLPQRGQSAPDVPGAAGVPPDPRRSRRRDELGSTRPRCSRASTPSGPSRARVQASMIPRRGRTPAATRWSRSSTRPYFPQPMYEALRDLSQDFLFPGLDSVPPNTVTLLGTNPKFVESFLVGLNAEMASELLWRNYPTDQRGTYFRQFWDAGSASDSARSTSGATVTLGENAGAGEKLVLLVRGELLRRYPNSVIYAVAAVSSGGPARLVTDPNDERHPLFRGTLKPDVTFLGFDLKRDDAIAGPGWFFVIQEQPTEPRFGLDAADFEQAAARARHVERPELAAPRRYAGRSSRRCRTRRSTKTALPALDNVTWGKNGCAPGVHHPAAPGAHRHSRAPVDPRARVTWPTSNPPIPGNSTDVRALHAALVRTRPPRRCCSRCAWRRASFSAARTARGASRARVPRRDAHRLARAGVDRRRVDWGQHFWETDLAAPRRTTTRAPGPRGSSWPTASTRRARRGSRARSSRQIWDVRPRPFLRTSRYRRRPCSRRTGRRRSRGRAPGHACLPNQWTVLGYKNGELSSFRERDSCNDLRGADTDPIRLHSAGRCPGRRRVQSVDARLRRRGEGGMAVRARADARTSPPVSTSPRARYSATFDQATDWTPRLTQLFDAHHYTDGLSFVPYGMPSNNAQERRRNSRL